MEINTLSIKININLKFWEKAIFRRVAKNRLCSLIRWHLCEQRHYICENVGHTSFCPPGRKSVRQDLFVILIDLSPLRNASFSDSKLQNPQLKFLPNKKPSLSHQIVSIFTNNSIKMSLHTFSDFLLPQVARLHQKLHRTVNKKGQKNLTFPLFNQFNYQNQKI